MPRETILIVDDDTELLGQYADILQSEGYEVLQATKGSEGLRLASVRPPDLVLLDVVMPDINGYEVLEQMRRRNIATRVIMATAHPFSLRDVIRCSRAGACDYLVKPFNLATFLAAIERALALEGTINLHVANDATPIVNHLRTKAEEYEQENRALKEQVRALRLSNKVWDFGIKVASLAVAFIVTLIFVRMGIVTETTYALLLFGVASILLLFPIDRLKSFTGKLFGAEATAEVGPPEQ
jgi:DNA-binding response OmpR family regulator